MVFLHPAVQGSESLSDVRFITVLTGNSINHLRLMWHGNGILWVRQNLSEGSSRSKEDATILHQHQRWFQQCILESWYIHQVPNLLNRDSGNLPQPYWQLTVFCHCQSIITPLQLSIMLSIIVRDNLFKLSVVCIFCLIPWWRLLIKIAETLVLS